MTQVRAAGVVAGIEELRSLVLARLRAGDRFAGLFATAAPDGGARDSDAGLATLSVAVADGAGVHVHETAVGARYACLTRDIPAAYWYERAVHDLFGIVPDGHPRLDPLVLPLPAHEAPDDQGGSTRRAGRLPCPGASAEPGRLVPDERAVPRHVHGPGLFTIPHGPVRSGVMESVEYLVETPGEDIPHLQVRVFAKHRGVERAFQGRTIDDAVLLAERAEGVSGVAHALAFAHALEALAGIQVPQVAADVRVLHAELERIANHLDAAVKLVEAAGLAVAVARFSWHKERLLRLRSRLCGNRFGRAVVVPGGITALPTLDDRFADDLHQLGSDIRSDVKALMVTSSFLDRIRTTGPLLPATARTYGALGPVGRASGYYDDARTTRPYDAYPTLGMLPASGDESGDAQARTRVRWHEITESFHLIDQVLPRLPREATGRLRTGMEGDGRVNTRQLRTPVPPVSGRGVGWAEAAQGEVIYVVDLIDGRVTRCWPRSASMHNLSIFHEVFAGDVLTDFPFIEASFGLSIAGVVM